MEQNQIIILTRADVSRIVVDAVMACLNEFQSHLPQCSSIASKVVPAKTLRDTLEISPATEHSYVKAGLLKPKHLGRKVYYDWDEVMATLSATSSEMLPPKLQGKKKTSNQQKTA